MQEVIGVYAGGTTTIYHQGRPYNVGVIQLRITKGEGAPEIITGYCRPHYQDSIIKNLSRISWVKPEEKEEMVKAENKPKIAYPDFPDMVENTTAEIQG